MNDLIISHMDAKVLKRLENYADSPTKLRAALGRYMKSLDITPVEPSIAVLEYLFRSRTHPTAEEIFNHLHSKVQTLTRSSVNTALEILAQMGAIQIVHVDTRDARFDGDTTHHAHLICANCGNIEDIPLSNNISDMIAIPDGCVVNDIQMMCLGLCAKCNQSQKVN